VTRAAVYVGVGRPLEICEVDVAAPRAGELKLRMAASGVCHSDLSFQNGTIPLPHPSMILGHEGAGVVEDVGPEVHGFSPGDHVCISFVPQCGDCFYCNKGQPTQCEVGTPIARMGTMPDGTCRTTHDGRELPQLCSVGTFAESTVIPQSAAVKIDPSVDLRSAALIGCGVLTGVGAALNTSSILAGDTVAVIGCGGVGLNVIQGARLAGAGEIIAIDVVWRKLELAREFGATRVIDAGASEPVEAVHDLTAGHGADVVFEAIGQAKACDQALAMTRNGGEAVFVGMPARDAVLELSIALDLVRSGKTLKGCYYGSSALRRDVPFLIDTYQAGSLKLDELISDEIALEQVNEAFDALERGAVTRSVIVY
jgi:S-(hydroxymethyl)glutathione dehydrogenase / alcohol dehydrogenase